MALSERKKDIRFIVIAAVVVAIIAAVLFVFFFDFSKSHKLKMGGYEMTEGGIRELRVEAKVKTHDYIYPWEKGISGTVEVYDGDTRIEWLNMGHARYTQRSSEEIATVRTMWERDAWVCENTYSATRDLYGRCCVAVGEDMDWLVVTNAFRADEWPRIWVFATDRDVGYEATERAKAQFRYSDSLQNPYE